MVADLSGHLKLTLTEKQKPNMKKSSIKLWSKDTLQAEKRGILWGEILTIYVA
jgi:hypothetical protein